MREIKFRAWDKEEGEMYTPTNIILLANKKTWAADKKIFNGFGFLNEDESKFKNLGEHAILMQFTGRKDKNGKEIYEGDIVQTNFDEEIIIQEVLFRSGAWMPFYWQRPHGLDYQETNLIEFLEFEVIGNIYENPKLLGDLK